MQLQDMLCAYLCRKIMGGNERDYRATGEIQQKKKTTECVKVGLSPRKLLHIV